MTFVNICIALFVCSQALYFTPLIDELFDFMVRSAEQWPTRTQCFTWYMWSSAARWGVQQRAVTSMVQWPTWCIDHLIHCMWFSTTSTRWEFSTVQWPAHFTCGLWLQGESAAWCSDKHISHMVFDCKVRMQHDAVTSTLYITWSWTARWECSMVQWPAHLHVVFDCKVRVQHGAVTSTLYITWLLTARWEWSMVQWPAHFTLGGLWLQGESAVLCSDQHTWHYVVFDCKVRVQHGAVTTTIYMRSLTARWEYSMLQSTAHFTLHVAFDCKVRVQDSAVTSALYMGSLTARWECSMVQWPAHFTLSGLWLQGESAAWCSDQHTWHYMWSLTARWGVQCGAVTGNITQWNQELGGQHTMFPYWWCLQQIQDLINNCPINLVQLFHKDL